MFKILIIWTWRLLKHMGQNENKIIILKDYSSIQNRQFRNCSWLVDFMSHLSCSYSAQSQHQVRFRLNHSRYGIIIALFIYNALINFTSGGKQTRVGMSFPLFSCKFPSLNMSCFINFAILNESRTRKQWIRVLSSYNYSIFRPYVRSLLNEAIGQ